MKIRNIFLALMAATVIFGCDDDDAKNGNEFSDLSPEQHKENLEQSGQNLVDKLEPMADMEAIRVAVGFQALVDTTFPAGDEVMYALQSVTQLEDGAEAVFNLKSVTQDPQKLAQLFNEHSGVYTFDLQTGTWEEESSDGELTFHFPTRGSEENDATISFTNFSFIDNPNTETSTEFPELLETLDGTLSVDGQELMSMDFNGAYDDEGLPTELSETIEMQDYVISGTMNRSSSEASYDQRFTYQGEDVLTSSFTVNGNLDYSTLSNHAENDVPLEQQEVISDANIEVNVDDIKFEGLADWGAIQSGMEDAMSDGSGEEMDSNFMELLVEILNENMILYVRYADSNEIIARSEFYVIEEQQDEQYEDYTDLIDVRMVFGDGSAVDESFFGEGFDDLIKRVNELITQAEENYGLNIQ
ncbi:MAG: hypothetical protein ACQEQ0_05840 [Bacteroidota bacterium]